MKMNKLAIIALAALLSMTSCLKDQADVFEEPSSARLSNYLEDVRTKLQESQYGWALAYVPGSGYATCYYALKFTAQQVEAIHQGDLDTSAKSYYKLTTDDGAVLSFDTYNTVLHYYATPDAGHYQARGGDFEFDIMGVEEDRILLRGKRSRNWCVLEKLTQEPKAFLQEMIDAEKHLSIAAFTGTVTGGVVEGYMDSGTHTLTIGPKGAELGEMTNVRYMITKKGISFNHPFTLQGVTFSELVQNGDTFEGSGIVFEKFYPEGWMSYEDYLGSYTFSYQGGTTTVKLAALEEGTSFQMEGFSEAFKPVLTYNSGFGRMSWVRQVVGGSESGLSYVLCPMDSNAGYLTWMEGAGMISYVSDTTVDKFVVQFRDNGGWENEDNYICDGWVLWMLSGTESAGQLIDPSFCLFDGSSYVMGPLTMTKIVE